MVYYPLCRDSPATVQRQSRDSPETVQRQSIDSPETVKRQQPSIISHWIDCLPLEQGWISQTSRISNFDHRQQTTTILPCLLFTERRILDDDNRLTDRVTGTLVEASLQDGLIKQLVVLRSLQSSNGSPRGMAGPAPAPPPSLLLLHQPYPVLQETERL